MPLTSTDKAIPRPGENRKIGPRSTSTSRDSSQQPRGAASVPRNHDNGQSSRRRGPSSERAEVGGSLRVEKLAPLSFNSSKPRMERQQTACQAVEDDTSSTSLTFNDTGWESEDQDVDAQPTTVFRPDWTQRLGGGNDDPSLDGFSDVEDAYEDDPVQNLSRETPSRTGAAAAAAVAPVTIKAAATRRRVDFFLDKESPCVDEDVQVQPAATRQQQQQAANVQSSLARHAEHRQEVRYSTPAQPSKVAASDEGADDSDHRQRRQMAASEPLTGTKRAHEDDVDYDEDELAGKSYADLDAVPFLTDPRRAASSLSTTTKAAASLTEQLENLTAVTAADQVDFFRSLDEGQNEQAAAWFAGWFADSVSRLRAHRLQRRKVALRYEAAARKRQRAVDAKLADCEAQLAEMKQGGSKLVEGLTPRREQ